MSGLLDWLLKIVGVAALPVVLAVLGYLFNESLKSQELNVKYVEIAVDVLSQPPSEETALLRRWAVDVINTHATVKISEELKDILVESEQLPVSALTNPTNGFKQFEGVRKIDKIIVSDTQNGRIESELAALNANKVSYHYLIAADGKVLSLVDENNMAFHTARHNATSIGIGLSHVSGSPYPEAQVKALGALLAEIAARHGLTAASVFSKSEFDPRKPSDFSTIKQVVVNQIAR